MHEQIISCINEIEKESKKLLKKMNQKQSNKEISELRKHIIQKTKDLQMQEVHKKEVFVQ